MNKEFNRYLFKIEDKNIKEQYILVEKQYNYDNQPKPDGQKLLTNDNNVSKCKRIDNKIIIKSIYNCLNSFQIISRIRESFRKSNFFINLFLYALFILFQLYQYFISFIMEETKTQPNTLKQPIEQNTHPTSQRTLRTRKQKQIVVQEVPFPSFIPITQDPILKLSESKICETSHFIITISNSLWCKTFKQQRQLKMEEQKFDIRLNNVDVNNHIHIEMKTGVEYEINIKFEAKFYWVSNNQLETKNIKNSKVLKNSYLTVVKIKIPETISDVFLDFTYQRKKDQIKKYNGLINKGSTCYMNSFLQMLYHLKQLRNIIFQMKLVEENKFPGTLQTLFYKLSKDTKPTSTEQLIKSYGWTRQESFVQQDVQQFSCLFFQVLQRKINEEQNLVGALNHLIQGSLTNYIQCVDIDFISQRNENFLDLQMYVSGIPDLKESIRRYIAFEMLEDNNRYHTQDYGLQRARKGIKINKFPPVLMIQLKRFEYNPITERNEKVLDMYQYQESLDLSEFTTQKISPYNLYAVLVHQGERATSGHYYAYIKIEGKWYKFNDESVTEATHRQVFDNNYGGQICKIRLDPKQLIIEQTISKIQSTAYLLVYYNSEKYQQIFNCPEIYPEWLVKEEMTKIETEIVKKQEDKIVNIQFTQWNKLKNYEANSCGFLNQQKLSNDKKYYFDIYCWENVSSKMDIETYIKNIIYPADLKFEDVTIWYLQKVKDREILVSIYEKRKKLTMNDLIKKNIEIVLIIFTKKSNHILYEIENGEYSRIMNNNNIIEQQISWNNNNQFTQNLKNNKIYVCVVKLYLINQKNQTKFVFDDFFYLQKKDNLYNNVLIQQLTKMYQQQNYQLKYYLQAKGLNVIEINPKNFVEAAVSTKNAMISIIVQKIHKNIVDPITLQKNFELKKENVLISFREQNTEKYTQAYVSKNVVVEQLQNYIFNNILQRNPDYISAQHILIKAKLTKNTRRHTEVVSGKIQDLIKFENTIVFTFSKLEVSKRVNNCILEFYYHWKNKEGLSEELNVLIDKKNKQEAYFIISQNEKLKQFLSLEKFEFFRILLLDKYQEKILELFNKQDDIYSVWKNQKGVLLVEGCQNMVQQSNYKVFYHHRAKTGEYISNPSLFTFGQQSSIKDVWNMAINQFKKIKYEFQGKYYDLNESKIKLQLYKKQGSPSSGLCLVEGLQKKLEQIFGEEKQLSLQITHNYLSKTIKTMKINV